MGTVPFMKPLDAQTRAFIDQMKAGGFRPANQIPLEESRRGLTQMARQMAGPSVEVFATEDRSIPGPGGDLPVRIYRPQALVPGARLPAVVFFHGGGFYLGGLDTHDHVCRNLCRGAGAVVVAVDYRLAPEHKFPAAVEDGYAALAWVAREAGALGIDPARIAVVGDSAGGTLVVTTCLLARERGGPKIALQVSVYPALSVTDGEEFPSRRRLGGGDYFISFEDFAFFRRVYLSDPEIEALLPLVSPIYAPDYKGLPPALMITAGYDPCVDEGHRYVERLRADGVPASEICYAGTIHPFFLFDGVIDAGRDAQQLVAGAVREFFGSGRLPPDEER
ncbi:MAG: alpha/beta hydrolase [Gammaproteobacteria bacterium]|nr:MAG: alpha/beta hydrolase [Gammaproteobacteria bacterium]